MKIYAFDVDETLEISRGPVRMADMTAVRATGNAVGICGNWSLFVRSVPDWPQSISFIGPMIDDTKRSFLEQVRRWIPAQEYIMVGNEPHDREDAEQAGWRFLKESEFAEGVR